MGIFANTNAHAAPIKITALGDSLVAGYGLKAEEAFPVRLEAALKKEGYDVTVTNAGVSGDTSAGGLARLDWALAEKPDIVILVLGANDALRGLPPEAAKKNLGAILEKLRKERVRAILAGMIAPLNLGKEYGKAFNAMYAELATQHEATLYPFFLEGVATNRKLNQGDGIHPNVEGVEHIVRMMLPYVKPVVEDRIHARKKKQAAPLPAKGAKR